MTTREQSPVESILLVVFAVFVFSSTFSIALSQIALELALLLFVIAVLHSRQRPFRRSLRYFYLSIIIWVCWLLFTAMWNGQLLSAVIFCREEWLFSIVLIGTYLCRRESRRQTLMTVLAVGVIIVSIYGVIQYFTGLAWHSSSGIDPAPRHGYRVMGTFGGLVTFSAYYAVAAASLLGYLVGGYKRLASSARYLLLFAAALAGLVTVLSFGRAAIAALVLTIVILTVILGRRYWRASLAVLAILVLLLLAVPGVGDRFVEKSRLDLSGKYEGGRVFIWNNSLKLISDHPWVGVGQGNFKEYYAGYLRPDIHPDRKVSHAHNDFLHVAAIAGLPGLALFSLLWEVLLCHLWVGYRKLRNGVGNGCSACFLAAFCGSVCFLAISMYHGTFVDEEVRALLMFVWAIGLSEWYNRSGRPKTAPAGSTVT